MAIPSNFTNHSHEQPGDPRAEYVRRLEGLKTKQAHYESQHHKLGISKLGLGGVTLVVVCLALAAKVISVLWVVAPLFAIVIPAVTHGDCPAPSFPRKRESTWRGPEIAFYGLDSRVRGNDMQFKSDTILRDTHEDPVR
jgi:hypothetical protein